MYVCLPLCNLWQWLINTEGYWLCSCNSYLFLLKSMTLKWKRDPTIIWYGGLVLNWGYASTTLLWMPWHIASSSGNSLFPAETLETSLTLLPRISLFCRHVSAMAPWAYHLCNLISPEHYFPSESARKCALCHACVCHWSETSWKPPQWTQLGEIVCSL